MVDVTRRGLLGAGAGGLAAASVLSTARAQGFGNPDLPPQGAINAADNPASLTVPGPHNPAIADQFPAANSPPATDTNDLPQFWASFNNAPKRIQKGGWARQVNQESFAISTTITGVDMRLTAGGIRELHWHDFAEWAYVTYGTCRITLLDPIGQAYVADVKEGELWFFPTGYPHSLQGMGPDGTEFILAFNSGQASEFSTLLVTDFLAHTPPDILAQNFRVPANAFSNIPLYDRYIWQGNLPGPLAADQAAVLSPEGPPKNPFTFSLSRQSRNQTGGEDRSLPRPCGQFWMIRRFTSAQFVPAKAGARPRTLWVQRFSARPWLHSSATPATRFFARLVTSQLVRD